MGERPFAKYAIVRVLDGDKEEALGVTARVEEDGKTVGWKATNNAKETSPVFVVHLEAVEFLVDGKVAAPKAPAKKVPAKAKADPGTCGRPTKSGNLCRTKAGAGTDHLGEGACKVHDGQPVPVVDDPKDSGQEPAATANALEGASDLTAALAASVEAARDSKVA